MNVSKVVLFLYYSSNASNISLKPNWLWIYWTDSTSEFIFDIKLTWHTLLFFFGPFLIFYHWGGEEDLQYLAWRQPRGNSDFLALLLRSCRVVCLYTVKKSLTHDAITGLIQLWVGWSLFLCILDVKQVDTNQIKKLRRHVAFWSIDVLSLLFFWLMLQLWAFFFFCFLGHSPAGLVCGITPQDPSRAGSQKRKQLWDNEFTVLWPDECLSEEWTRKLGACQESHTQCPWCPYTVHIL